MITATSDRKKWYNSAEEVDINHLEYDPLDTFIYRIKCLQHSNSVNVHRMLMKIYTNPFYLLPCVLADRNMIVYEKHMLFATVEAQNRQETIGNKKQYASLVVPWGWENFLSICAAFLLPRVVKCIH